MNNESNSPSSSQPTDLELEERIVAWVAGEASAFEIAVLADVIAKRPELAAFKRRIEAVHGLVGEAARPEAKPLRLSPDRRKAVLAVIGGAVPQEKPRAAKKMSALRHPVAQPKPFWRNDWFYSAAACLVICIVGFGMLHSLKKKAYQPGMAQAAYEISPEEARMSLMPMELSSSYGDDSDLASLPEPANTVGYSETETHGWSAPMYAVTPSAPRQRDTVKFSASMPEVRAARGYLGDAEGGTTGVLEPFEVVEQSSVGYKASSSMTGSRIRLLAPQLTDVASSISVVSGEPMKDTGTRGGFLKKRKGAAVPQDEEEVVVLSPFSVSDDTGFLRSGKRRSYGYSKPNRPAPDATMAGMGPAGINPDAVAFKQIAANSTDVTEAEIARVRGFLPKADMPLQREGQQSPVPAVAEVDAANEPVSTFSLHVSDASFKLALSALATGRVPNPASIRPEEFYNAFDYGDPAPLAGEPVSCRVEQCAHPFAQQRNLVRIAVRVPATGRGSGTPLHLTVLLDTSGSMERPDRRATVRAALSTLVGLLGPDDRVTLVGFSRQPRLLVEATDGTHANQLVDMLDRTPAEGGTNLEEALKLGGELATRHFTAGAQNRIVLLTDGAANLGNADPERLAAAIETLRSQRIAFDACGVGLEGIDDEMLESLTRKGDGRYYVLDSPESADAGFARQLAGAFRPAAENVKVQVRFNPSRVGHYRLVGFEKHRLREQDFRNDAVDAAEISAEEAAVALYEIEAKPDGEGELGEVFVRFRDPTARTMVERSWTLAYEPRVAAFDRATPSLQLAGTAAALAEKLRGGPAGAQVDLDVLAPIVNAQRSRRPDDARIKDLATMFEQIRRVQN